MKVSDIFERLVDPDALVGVRAFDGSQAGSPYAETVVEVRSPQALRYIATAPGELGLARAYVMGAVEVRGDLYTAVTELLAHRRDIPKRLEWLPWLRQFGLSTLHRPPLPPEELPAAWRRRSRRHSRARDAASVAHHYDISNRFYELVIGPSMTYSCAVFPSGDASLETAQIEKIDLICRKLDLRPGQRLLDVGAGWGALVRHAAEHYGVHALGVTLSAQQVGWAERAISEAGLTGRAEVRHLDYRDVPEAGFDAISSVGTMEHIGRAELGSHFSALAGKLSPEGRMLNHTITRPSNRERNRTGPFLDRYIFPDGELEGPGTVVAEMHDNGFEVRHSENLREHYALTLRNWAHNLDSNWDAAVAEVGERRARAWRLYMTMSRVAFESNRIQIHQFLGVRVDRRGRSGMPLRPGWERPAETSEELTRVGR